MVAAVLSNIHHPIRILLLIFLTLLLCLGTIPGYLNGNKWHWQNPTAVMALTELKILRKQGLQLPGWQTQEQRSVVLGEHPWSIQQIKNDRSEDATVFLFTQNGPRDQPQVEWSEINGVQRWQTDSETEQGVQVQTAGTTIPITTKIFRAWTSKRTYGVVQWYAWSDGGHPSPSHWFLADRIAQLQGKRQPWVAVSILVPMEPLDDLNKYRDRLMDLTKTVHSQLYDRALRPLPPASPPPP